MGRSYPQARTRRAAKPYGAALTQRARGCAMFYRVDLVVRAADALDELPRAGHREVMETIAALLLRRDAWPAIGGEETATWFGARCWVVFGAYADGIELYDVGWAG